MHCFIVQGHEMVSLWNPQMNVGVVVWPGHHLWFPAAIAVNWRELLSGALFSESVWHALPAAIPKSWSQIFTFLAVLFSFGLAPCLVFHSNLTQGRYGVMARKLNTLTDQKR